MPPIHVAPAITLQAFSCPHCGALADQNWFWVRASVTEKGEPPLLLTPKRLEELRKEFGSKQEMASVLEHAARKASGRPFLKKLDDSKWTDYELQNLHVSRCYSCRDIAIWR